MALLWLTLAGRAASLAAAVLAVPTLLLIAVCILAAGNFEMGSSDSVGRDERWRRSVWK